MAFKVSYLFSAPEVNPENHKARSVPVFNPINKYGRTFFFSWLGFMVAFFSWYAFPPLLNLTIRADLGMTQDDYLNSNIVALCATLLVRVVCGPLCDRFGARYVFVGCLLAGSIPTAMAGLVTNPRGLIALRFFVGILGGSFVPCQVWMTGFFDKNIVGTGNALAGGWGNAGGGITYFIMPAVFDSLVHRQGLTPHVAWRVAFIVPFIIIVFVALGMLFLCDDTPTGSWATRNEAARSTSVLQTISSDNHSESDNNEKKEKYNDMDSENQLGRVDTQAGVVVVKPTFRSVLSVANSRQTWALAAPYAASFGGELAINSIIGSYYLLNFPSLGQTGSGRWAAMFGLLNIVFRPMGGVVADLLYKYTGGSIWGKKMWLVFLGVMMGVFELIIGLIDPKQQSLMFGLVAGLAVFMDAANGANFAIVPHVHPHANGVLSGIIGATGNLGGIIGAIVFRFNGKHYGQSIWIIGAISIGVNLAVAWVRPVPKGQLSY